MSCRRCESVKPEKLRLIIPGAAVAAALMAGVDLGEWVDKTIAEMLIPEGVRLRVSYTVGPPVGKWPLSAYTMHILVEVRPEAYVWIAYELQHRIYRAVYGLPAHLTERELAVLRMRIFGKKSIAETASALGVKPQTVVAFQRSIKRKVQKHLVLP